MLVRRLILLFVCCLLQGCAYRDPSVELLESELRWMEDQVYQLEDELQSTNVELSDCRCDPAQPTPARPHRASQPKKDRVYSVIEDEPMDSSAIESPAPKTSPSPPGGPARSSPEPKRAEPRPQYSIEREEEPSQPRYQIVEPTVELPDDLNAPTPAEPTPSLPEPGQPPVLDNSDDGDPIREIELQSFYWEEPPRKKGSAQRNGDPFDVNVTHIVAEGTMTDGYDFDNEPCPPGLLVVIQPRNAEGQLVSLAGPLSVVVLDSTQRGSAARIARWDIDAAEARRSIRDSHYGRGIHLNLAWTDSPPDTDQLYLFVRYTTVEGRKLECDSLVVGQRLPQWQAITRDPHPRKSTPSPPKTNRLKTQPIDGTVNIELRPIPMELDVERVAHEAPVSKTWAMKSAAEVPAATAPVAEMPTIRNSKRPRWSPHR
jgi:hypothetical protein